MQWDCWHLLEAHMEKGGVPKVVTKNTARITGVFSATPANAGVPSIARPPSNARYSRTHLST